MRCDHRPLFSPISTLAMLTLAASALLAACNKGGDLKKPDTGPTGGQTARVTGHVSETVSGPEAGNEACIRLRSADCFAVEPDVEPVFDDGRFSGAHAGSSREMNTRSR